MGDISQGMSTDSNISPKNVTSTVRGQVKAFVSGSFQALFLMFVRLEAGLVTDLWKHSHTGLAG
jgi:hypothetical protein